MGFDCHLVDAFSFIYRAEFADGVVEHEYDHVLLGEYDRSPSVNPIEVAESKLVSVSSLIADVNARPDDYTYWLKAILRSSGRPWVGGSGLSPLGEVQRVEIPSIDVSNEPMV